MGSRLKLHEVLCEILGNGNVYFQPPASVSMCYPAIVYSLGRIDNTYADNAVYRQSDSYELTLIDEDPDSEFIRKLSLLPKCRFDRHYKKDNLNHYTFTLHY